MSQSKKRPLSSESDVKLIGGKLLAVGGDFEKSKEIVIDSIQGVETLSGTLVDYTDSSFNSAVVSGQLYTDSKKVTKDINIILGDGERVIPPGLLGYSAPVSFNGNLLGWKLAEISNPPVSGTIEIDILKSTFTAYPPTEGDSITDTNPTLLNQYVNQSNTLSGWDVQISNGDSVGFKVISNLNCKSVHLILSVETGVI